MSETLESGDTKEPRQPARVRSHEIAYFVVVMEAGRPASSSRHFLVDTDEVVFVRMGKTTERWKRESRAVRIRLDDPYVSSKHATLRRHGASWLLRNLSRFETIVRGANGASEALREGDERLLVDGDVFSLGASTLMFRCVRVAALPAEDGYDLDFSSLRSLPVGLQTWSVTLEAAIDQLVRIAASNTSVVILGETGTGKEKTAEAIHALSPRKKDTFVAIDCAALPQNLVEEVLFGHVKGAFTGAVSDKVGQIEKADRGSLFLDEIGELPVDVQVKLLRTLQQREVQPVGGSWRSVDIRLIAATNRALGDEVSNGSFRSDLWHRINGYTVTLRPLRDRREDLGLIIGNLMTQPELVTFAPDAVAAMMTHAWPGNVRELTQLLQRALALKTTAEISAREIVFDTPGAESADPESQRITQLLREHKGNVVKVADALGKSRPTVYRWLEHFGIDPDTYR